MLAVYGKPKSRAAASRYCVINGNILEAENKLESIQE